jgi:hypothetical protein
VPPSNNSGVSGQVQASFAAAGHRSVIRARSAHILPAQADGLTFAPGLARPSWAVCVVLGQI